MRLFPIIRRLRASVFQHHAQYIELHRLDTDPLDFVDVAATHKEFEFVAVESADAFRAFSDEFPTTFRDSFAELRRRLREGCIVFLVRRPREARAGMEVVAYSLSERGVFSALGRRGPISPDFLFGHWAEVLPKYRGQGIHLLLRAGRAAYCRENEIRAICGAITRSNLASIRATGRAGSKLVGVVRRLSLLRGLVVWETPWARIERALGGSVPRREL